MADEESDLESDRLEFDLETLFVRHCSDESSLKSKEYCTEFCKLVEEYTGRWQVPLPQLKVLRTAMICFTNATAAFPDDCQHIHYALSSLALSFFELMLFFSKEEFGEDPLKDILDSFQECHSRLLRHRNVYLQQVKQVIKVGGPWESPVLKTILREAAVSQAEVEEYLSSEVPVFLELRVRYLQACERMQEAMALAKSCLEHRDTGRHLYFHQAYLTCLHKASLHEHLHKEMAEIDGRDAVEIICNTESVEKDELLLSLCKAFLTQQLHNGDMYYIWDLVFIWSRLHLRAHPSRLGFLAECRQLAYSATNVRAIFPFIKVLTVELGNEGVQFCVELCALALQLCDPESDLVTRSLVCKTIAFLLPQDLEVCRACALQVFCKERTLEAYRTVCLLYTQPDQEPHPHSSPLRTDVRFHILQMLKEGLCFDPEFWNLLTLRTHCLELISDNDMKAAVLSEMKEEEEEEEIEYQEEPMPNSHTNDSCTLHSNTEQSCPELVPEVHGPVHTEERAIGEVADPSGNAPVKKRTWRRRRRRRIYGSDEEPDLGDDPEIKYHLEPSRIDSDSKYSLRRDAPALDSSAPVKLPPNRQREYLSRHVKNKILKRKGRKKRWLQGLPRPEQVQAVKEAMTQVKGKKRGRRPLQKLEVSYPENEVSLEEEEDTKDGQQDERHEENGLELKNEPEQILLDQINELEENRLENHAGMVDGSSLGEDSQVESQTEADSKPSEGFPSEPQPVAPAIKADPELDGPVLALLDSPIPVFHTYSLISKELISKELDTEQPPESTAAEAQNGDSKQQQETLDVLQSQVKGKISWREKILRAQRYGHMTHHCTVCKKVFKGLNVLRHALSHLKKRKRPRCILCGKRFKTLPFAKTHVLQHIEEMCRNKPSAGKSVVFETNAEVTPIVNGMEEASEKESEDQAENQPSDTSVEQTPEQKPKANPKPTKPTLGSVEETPEQKPKAHPKPTKPTLSSVEQTPEQKPRAKPKPKPTLSRESRIIRNLRTIIKKTSYLHKLHGKLDFRDEQVIIKQDVVIVKAVPVTGEEGGEEGKEKQDVPVTEEEGGEEGKEKRDVHVTEGEGGEEGKEKQDVPVTEEEGGEEGKEKRDVHVTEGEGGEEGQEKRDVPVTEGQRGEEGQEKLDLPVTEGRGGEEGQEKQDIPVTEGGEEGQEKRDVPVMVEEGQEKQDLPVTGGEEEQEKLDLPVSGGEEGQEKLDLPVTEKEGVEERKEEKRDVPVTEGEERKEDTRAGEDGCEEEGTIFYLCPSETCDRVFMRMSRTVLKHAIKCHIKEEQVIEKAFFLAKRKCILCFRRMQYLQHYKDHMKLHDDPLRHFCYHPECSQRFLTPQTLKSHIKTHEPFRPQCRYMDCNQLFSSIQALCDHEWRHYTQTPQREVLEPQTPQGAEAPWKQRVKIKKTWPRGGKGQKEAPKPHHQEPSEPVDPAKETDGGDAQAEGTVVSDISGQDPSKSDAALERTVSFEPRDFNRSLINGHEEATTDQVTQGESSTSRTVAPVAPDQTPPKKPPPEDSHLNVKEVDDISTLSEGIMPKVGVPHIAEHKTFKPEDPAYQPLHNNVTPFVRPPPSTYLHESELCMRKRRSTDEVQPPRKRYISWMKKKKEVPAPEKKEVEPEAPQVKTRQRCIKCLASFSTLEELKRHQALNTCSALFSFDSDDDS